MSFAFACPLADVPTDEALAVLLDGQPVAVARDGDDVYEVALSEGEVEHCTIECWLHGSRFDLRTGAPTGLPATEPIATFPVDVRERPDGARDVFVDITRTLNGVTPG